MLTFYLSRAAHGFFNSAMRLKPKTRIVIWKVLLQTPWKSLSLGQRGRWHYWGARWIETWSSFPSLIFPNTTIDDISQLFSQSPSSPRVIDIGPELSPLVDDAKEIFIRTCLPQLFEVIGLNQEEPPRKRVLLTGIPGIGMTLFLLYSAFILAKMGLFSSFDHAFQQCGNAFFSWFKNFFNIPNDDETRWDDESANRGATLGFLGLGLKDVYCFKNPATMATWI
jgi:hypothetical protein